MCTSVDLNTVDIGCDLNWKHSCVASGVWLLDL